MDSNFRKLLEMHFELDDQDQNELYLTLPDTRHILNAILFTCTEGTEGIKKEEFAEPTDAILIGDTIVLGKEV